MSHTLFDKHRATLDGALKAIRSRGFWSPYAEIPKAYGDTAMADGKGAFDAHLNKRFALGQAGEKAWAATEKSPYGVDLGVSYPVSDADALLAGGLAAMPQWRKLGAEGRVGVCLEILDRINKRSFEMSHAVMLTSGQGWAMAFQAGGPHAQDRGLEAVAYAWQEMSQVPAEATWEKPQGKNPPLVMRKHYEIVGRGVSLVIGCSTFPTWNSYPGMFAALATGNAVIVKPHPNAILPVAITVRIVRDVLQENGVPPDLVTLCVDPDPAVTQKLATHPAVKSVDYTGGNAFGSWLLENCGQAQVYAEMAGVNNVVIESTDNYKGLLRNLAFTLSLYSGQMCTTTQALIVPADGIGTPDGKVPFDQVAADLGAAIDKLLGDPAVAGSVLGAINSEATLKRIEDAPAWGEVVLASRKIEHADFPRAQVRSPVLLKTDASNEKAYMEERFGPISFVVRTKDADAAVALSERLVREKGALTVGLYSTRQAVIDAMTEATLRAGVALSVNLTGGVYVNQSAGFSDYHGTGANPAANACYTDSAFVANRFRVIQRREHI
ncbi:MAG TPA: phenylacetic acid degradation protein PaaN [Burkholderiales bacterium]|nr:phenylacetic acid degradation protein PaaN [Burkholderiales bacterium]